MKFSFRRVMSLVLALVMVLGMVPSIATHAHAAGTLTVTDSNVGLAWTDASNSSGKANWSASGNTVVGTATGYKALGVFSKTVTTSLTITNNHSEDRTLVFDYTLTGGGSVSGIISATSGSYSATLAAGASVTITLTSPSGTSTNTLTLSGLQLLASGNVTATFLPAENGSYTVDGTAITAQTTMEKEASESYALVATPDSGYMFFGWYSEATDSYLSYDAQTTQIFGTDPQVKPVFLPSNTALFGVGAAKFADLTEACNFANSSSASTKTVVLLNDGTVSGSHTIPAGITLLVPFNSSNTLYTSSPACTSSFANNAAWVKPTAYRTLTLTSDANITVNGAICVSAQHAASNGGKPYSGAPTGPVGWVKMTSGSQITLNSGANLYAWGYIQGSGNITVKGGATVYENFQFTDFRGGSNLTAMITDGLVFPINQYYVQNIEVATRYEAGAMEKLYTSAYASSMVLGGEASFIGEGGMFVINSGYIVKDYIENKDRLQVDVYGDITMSSMVVDVGQEVNSADYILPITNNITINVNSGTTTVQQSVALTPGVEMTIAQGATLDIGSSATALNDYNTAGHNLVVYDSDEWFYGFTMPDENGNGGGEIVENVQYAFGSSITGMYPLPYAPGRTYNRTAADLKDAVLDVNGTVLANGFLYTTLGGGNIKSSGKTGTIVMQAGSGFDMFTFQANGETSLGIMMNSAALMNGDGSYLNTITFDADYNPVTYAEAGATFNYCATCDKWVQVIDVTFEANEGTGTMTPQQIEFPCCGEKLNANAFTREGFTFNSWNTAADGTGTTYADKVLFTGTESTTLYAQWMKDAVEYTITFHDDEGTVLESFDIEEGATPAYSGTPTKASTDDCHDFQFKGWATEIGGEVITIPAATADADYYAVFELVANENHDTTAFIYTNNGNGTHQKQLACCGEVVNAAETCTDGTDKDHNCDECGAANIEDHTPGTAVEEDRVEATCGTDGSYNSVVYCTECGEELSSTPNTIPATGNHVDGTDKDHNCDECGATDIEDHTPGTAVEEDRVEATCGTAGSYNSVVYCTECGEKLSSTPNTIPATGNHVDGDDKNHDCDNCSATNVDGGHHGGSATCIALAVCDECGQSYGAYGDHKYNQTAYTNITATHHTVSHICQHNANHIVNDEPVEHTYVNGVCDCTATKSYTITWSVNGVETKTTVAHGAVPTAPTAEKADTAEFDYTFSHWEDADGNKYTEIPAATADVTYTAVFTSEKQVYTITWNVEGVKTTTSVAYGETPAYNGTPTKAATAEYTYDFAGWDPAVTSVTGDATYTAQFTAKANQYVLTFNYNYEAYLKQLSVDYNVTIAADSMKYYSTHTREGYTLTGWNTAADGSGEPFDVTQEFTMPAKDVTIYAQWELNEYLITWNVEGVETTTTVKHGETPVFEGTPAKEADAQYTYTFAGWTPEVVAATGVATYTAQFTPVLRSYDITFVVDGVETKVPTSYGQTPVIADPTKDADAYYSYTFAGWTPEVVAVTGEATYTATWSKTPVEYTVTFVMDGEAFHVVKGGYGEAVDTSDLPSTDKTGYTFNGWDAEIPATFPAKNIVINGSHTVNQYTITFKNGFEFTEDDAFEDYTITKNYGEAITAEDIAALEATLPTITGWNFQAWYNAEEVETEGEKAWEYTSKYEIPETMGAADVTVYAKWEEIKYILNVLSSIDNTSIASSYMVYDEYYQTLEDFNKINAFCYDGSCEDESHTHLLPAGYSFAGYKYVDDSDVTFPYSHPAEDVTIVAQFVPNNYTVIFMNGDKVHDKVTAAYGSAINLPENPTKEGYVFAGWVDVEGKAVDLSTMPLNGMEVFATFSVDSFKLNFFATEGDAAAVATFEIPFGTALTGTPDDPETEEDESASGYLEDLLTQVGAPTKEGHTFQNWNVSDVPATMPAEAVNIYGNWSVNSYNVNWVIDVEAYTTTSVAYGSAITEPETPVKEGHTFSGWTGIPATMPAQDVTVRGEWAVNTYTITFDVEGIDPITAEYGTEITWPAYPSKTGFWFMGWSTDGKTVIALPETMPADGLALKAVWAKLSYWIYWNVEGQETGEEYKYGDIIDAPEATKASDAKYTYKFVGWKNTSDEIVEFPVTVTENMTYYAVFEQDQKVPYTVKFVDGENTVYETQIAWDGEVTLEGFEAPTKEHYILTWTVAGEEVSFPYAMDTKEVTFVANWIPVTYTIYFYASQEAYNEGEVLHSISAPYGTEVAQGYTYTAPEGWNFTGWKTSGSLDFSFPCTMGGEDVHLIAQLSKKIYTATFVNGEWSRTYHVGYANPVSLSVNGTLDTPSDHDGYSFKGWFDETGVAYTDEYTMPAHDVTFTAKWTYTGWYTDEAGTTYLFDDEKAYFGVWSNIDGAKYWFDANSYIVKDITLINGSYYAFDHESGKFLADYTGIYTASNGDLYYVENGVAVANKGLTKTVDADGHIHYYYFGCGMANCDCGGCTGEYVAQKGNTHWAEIDNGYLVKWDYTFDENGVVIHDEDTSKNGVHLDEGVKYYYIDGVKVHYGLFIGDDGEYYYARSNGSLVVSRDYWISESHLNGVERDGAPVEEGSYTFDAEGRIVWPTFQKNGIYAEDGSLYYYVDGERTYAGLIKYTGDLVNADNSVTADVYAEDTIYVRTNGELAVNRSYWTTKNNGLMASATYNFDEYGRMIRTNGFVHEDGGIYYYVNGSRYHAGLIMVNGDYYYVKTSGQVVTGCRYWITHTNGYDVAEGSYEFDADGKMIIPEPEVLKNGIVEENGGLWYYVDGKPNYAGLIQYTGTLTREDGTVVNYENAWIYVRTSGELVVGRSYWVTKNNGAMKSATYQFDENGIMQ